MKVATILVAIIFLTMKSRADIPATTQPGEEYQLVWSDEFDRDGPLEAKDWRCESGFVRNRELQWYQQENAFCKDGHLIIEARREHKPNPRYNPDRPKPTTSPADLANPFFNDPHWRNRETIEYTAASVNTSGKHAWLYGRFEIRAKIDVRSGSWPAFWTLGNNGPWPANGEVDIMEYYDRTVLANVAWAGKPGNTATWNDKRLPLASFGKDWPDQFHTWRMDWNADSIKLYLDDVLVNSQDLSNTLNAQPLPGGAVENPFHTPMYILLNQAIGGTRGGDPSATEFPIRYVIEYVRVWQTPSQKLGNGATSR
jgi:beta-glucanase (GH16 family)